MPDSPTTDVQKPEPKPGMFADAKVPVWGLLLAAFGGGIVLQLAELASMFKLHQSADFYFFGGMLVAGVMGVGGLFLTGATSIRSAIAAGVSAPQLLGGVIKAVPTTALMIQSAFTPIYAQPVQPMDSVTVMVISDSPMGTFTIACEGWSATVMDGSKLSVPKVDSLTITRENEEPYTFAFHPDTAKEITILRVTPGHERIRDKFFRGLIGQRVAPSKFSVKAE